MDRKTFFFIKLFIISHFLLITTSYRLETNCSPSNYRITLTVPPDFGNTGIFEGDVDIYFSCEQSTENFQLNQGTEISMYNITLRSDDGNLTDLYDSHLLDETTSILTVYSTTTLNQSSTYILTINYAANFSDDDFGFYRSSYEMPNGNLMWIAATQFQPIFARRAIPCFDEPTFKATFDLSIVRPADLHSLANTRLNSSENVDLNGTMVKDTFETTPVMSTYLLAFVISNHSSLSNTSINYTVWAREEQIHTAEYAFEIGPKLLTQMESFTDISYPSLGISKLDQIAIPDFAAGAMENWGLVTYREVALLWDQNQSTIRNKQQIATVNSHEFAHMWFGNLVTCEWWSFAWLNEALASYFEWFNTADIELGYELEKQFVVEAFQGSLKADSLASSRSLTSEVNTLSEVLGNFDIISYSKGASVIRMIQHFMGISNFKSGLQQYLVDNAYETVVPNDLWTSLQSVSTGLSLPATISTIMGNWTDQSGHPVLHVILQDSNVIITQHRFLYDSTTASSTNWYVPVTFTTSTNPDFDNTQSSNWLIPNNNLTLSNVLTDDSQWILLNIQSTGYYRVNYDVILWERLLNALLSPGHDNIHVLNRAQIIDDAFDLARANLLSYDVALQITTYLKYESEYYPWYAAFQGFAFLRQRFSSDEQLTSLLNNYVVSYLMTNLTDSLSFSIDENVREIEIIKQQLFLSWACTLGDPTCVTESLELFQNYRHNDQTINPNLRSIVFCTALRHSDSNSLWDNWHFLWNRTLETTSASERGVILTSLGCTHDTDLLNIYLNHSIDPSSGVRSQDAPSIFASVLSGNPEGVAVAFDFFRNNHQEIINHYGGINPLPTVITGIATRLRNETEIDEFESFFNNNNVAISGIDTIVSNAVQNARSNIAWANTYSEEVKNWLSIHESNTSAASLVMSGNILTMLFGCFIAIYIMSI